jgi:ATP-dependent helicase/DNAse subunit B
MKIEAKLLVDSEYEQLKDKLFKLSVSKAKTFDDCKAKYRFAYIEKLPRIDRDFHVFGKFLHQVLENFHSALIKDPSKKDSWELALSDAWDAALHEYQPTLTQSQIVEAKSIIAEYVAILKEDGLPDVIAVEQPFWVSLNDRVLLNGFIDRVQRDSDGLIHVIDYKTTKDPKYLNDFFQLLTYAYTLMLEDPDLKRIRASFVLLRHDFMYKTQEYSREEVMSYVGEKFIKYADSIDAEKVWRPSPQFLCKYCDYLEHCQQGNAFLVKRGVIQNKPIIGLQKW